MEIVDGLRNPTLDKFLPKRVRGVHLMRCTAARRTAAKFWCALLRRVLKP